MARCSIWSASLLLLLSFTTTLCLHLIREKGSKTTLTCNFKQSETYTVWQVRAGREFVNVSSCTFATNSCVSYMPDEYTAEVLNVPDGFESNLIITSVRTNATHFKCLGKYVDEKIHLEVYTEPKHPTCDPVVVDSKKNLLFKCRAQNVHPSLNAVLNIREFALSHHDVLSIHCKNQKHGSLNHDGHSAECTCRIKAGRFEPGTYSYYMTMHPHLSNYSGIKVPSAVTEDYNFTLSIPTVSIDEKHCSVGPAVVDGKVIPNSKASCRCVLEEKGFPPAHVEWLSYSSRTREINDFLNGSSTLIILSDYPDQHYVCRARSPLKHTHSHSHAAEYSPVFEAPKESHSQRTGIAVGVVVCLVALAAIVAAVVWRWRTRRRQQSEAISIGYSNPMTESEPVADKPETSGDRDRLVH
ncbi:hypothetical protein BsWGS_12394 [Bradybaena similaris]